MKRITRVLSVVALALAANIIFAQELPEKFEFRFEQGKTLSYHTVSTIEMDMKMNVMGMEQDMAMKIDLFYDMDLTPVEYLPGGSTIVLLQPANIKALWDMDQAGNTITMELDGKEVTAETNGMVFIDTKNGTGVADAQSVIDEMAGLYESGNIEIKPNGNIGEITGSPEFVSFWNDNMETTIGFFGIVFSENPVDEGQIWKVPFRLSKMGDIIINEPLNFEVEFKWTGFAETNGENLYAFHGNSPFDATGITGSMGDESGELKLDINTFQRSANFNILFDKTKGLVISNKTEIDGQANMSADIEGSEMTMDMDMKATMVISLIP